MSGQRVSTAPLFRSVCALTGQQASDRFFAAAGPEADARIAESERLRVENADLRTHVEDLREALAERNAVIRRMHGQMVCLVDERDTAAALLAGLRGVR